MKIVWDKKGEHFYENGVSKGVLYPINPSTNNYEPGVAWNGLSSVNESPEGAEVTSVYADNIKYLDLMSAEEFKGTIEAYTYPDKFAECDGSASLVDGIVIGQQTRKKFGLCYTTQIGNDVTSDLGHKIHLVYNCLASPSERSYETINDSPEAITFSWEFSTTPVEVTNYKPTATLTIDSTKLDAAKLKLIEDKLYGTEESEPTLLLPDEIVALVNNAPAETVPTTE